MLCSYLDHMTVTAPSLAAGVDYVRRTLGVTPQAGGEHPRMGTHNCFVRLGEAIYLEIISVNPEAAAPKRPRWFQLDDLKSNSCPRLATWIARTNDIEAAVSASPIPLGDVEPMSRGDLKWLMTIPEDGSMPLRGIAPILIQWSSGTHAANALQDLGCSLVGLQGFHPEAEKVRSVLEAIGFQGEFCVSPPSPGEPPCLVAHIRSPAGPRELSASDIAQVY